MIKSFLKDKNHPKSTYDFWDDSFYFIMVIIFLLVLYYKVVGR